MEESHNGEVTPRPDKARGWEPHEVAEGVILAALLRKELPRGTGDGLPPLQHCAACGGNVRSRQRQTMLVPFHCGSARPAGETPATERMYPPLTLVCERHVLWPADDIMEAITAGRFPAPRNAPASRAEP